MSRPICEFCHVKMTKVAVKGKTWWECRKHPRIRAKKQRRR